MPDHLTTDVEDPVFQSRRASDLREFIEAGFLLAMWSIIVANDGAFHFLQHGVSSVPALLSAKGPNRFCMKFLSDLFEVIVGLFGLSVGLGAALLSYYNRTHSVTLIATQIVLGWYGLINYVILIPAFTVSKILAPVKSSLSVGACRFIGVINIMTSIAFWFALQGGQFVFVARLVAFSTERDFLKQRSCAKLHAIFWNFNLALAGLWAVLTGCVVIASTDAGLTSAQILAPPSVNRISVHLLTTGLIMFVWPLIGIVISISGHMNRVRLYAVGSFFFFLAVQLGFVAAAPDATGPATVASLDNGFVMMITFLGPYFMLKQAQEDVLI